MLRPERKPVPIKLFNLFSKSFYLNSQLSFDQLINKARKHTGLFELGHDFNSEALEVLVKSINQEAELTPFGKLMIREKLIGQLENRLWATHWFSKFPEILGQELLPVVMITGLQRTGTTKMQRLLSSLPDARGLFSWEALYPAPIGLQNETEKRIARTRRNEQAVKWISPAFHAIHPIHTNQPEEDVLLLDVHFMSTSSEAIMHVPSYADWLGEQDQTLAYAYEKNLLKLLQWQRSGKFWVIKSPHHLEYLDSFTTVFPNSTILWMHRSILSCIPSFLNMLYISRGMFSNHVDENALKVHWTAKLVKMVQNGIAFRSRNLEKIIDVSFEHFMNSEDEIVNKICEHMQIDFHQDHIAPVVNEKYISKHQYQLSDWNLKKEDLEQQFASYETLVNTLKSTKNP